MTAWNTCSPKPALPARELRIRWAIQRDMPNILVIEAAGFVNPWSEDDFKHALRQPNIIGMVAEGPAPAFLIHGFMVYQLHERHLEILNFAVAPDARRQGIGTTMLLSLKRKLASHRRQRIDVKVSERNLAAQLFCKSRGFRALRVLRGYYENGDDAYLMCYETKE